MTDRFTLRSVDDDGELAFTGAIPRDLTGEDWVELRVSLATRRLSAHSEAADMQPQRWSEFFESLAGSWRGWTGTRSHGSLEGHLVLEARSDATGHVELRVTLIEASQRSWRAEAVLRLEAGSLARIARQARAYFG
jgi:hypothetical protein